MTTTQSTPITRPPTGLRHLSEQIADELALLVPVIQKATIFDPHYNRDRTAWEVVVPDELSNDNMFSGISWWGFRTRKEAQAHWDASMSDVHGGVTAGSMDTIPWSPWVDGVLDRHDPEGIVERVWAS